MVQGEKNVRRSSKKSRKKRGTRRETNPQTNNQSSPMRRREDPIKGQNRVNDEKDRNTQRRETEDLAGRK